MFDVLSSQKINFVSEDIHFIISTSLLRGEIFYFFDCRPKIMLLICPLCPDQKFTVIARYRDHADAAHPSPRKDYLCPGCPPQDYPKRFRQRALEEHIRSTHRVEDTTSVLCKDCGLQVIVGNIKSHLQRHAKETLRYTCPHSNCNAVFQSASLKTKFGMVYNKHNLEVHNNSPLLPSALPAITQQVEDFNDDHYMDFDKPGEEDATGEGTDVPENTEQTFANKFLAFWLQTQFCDLLPESQVNKMIAILCQLASESSEHLATKLKLLLPNDQAIIDDTFRKHDLLTKNFLSTGISNAYGRRKQLESVAKVLHPEVLTSFPQLQSSKKSEIYLVPLADIIEQELARHNWDPDRQDGYYPEFEYIQKLRYSYETKTCNAT